MHSHLTQLNQLIVMEIVMAIIRLELIQIYSPTVHKIGEMQTVMDIQI